MDMKKSGARVSAALRRVSCLLGAVWLAACGAELPEESSPMAQQEQPVVTLPILINTGGGAFTDTYGRLWQADPYGSGAIYKTTEPISGTENDGLYQSMRSGHVTYEIPVPGPGIYTVQFLLIEPERNLGEPRSMVVEAEGDLVVDLYKSMVTPLRSYNLYFDVPVTDSALSLSVKSAPGSSGAAVPGAVVSAIEVTASKWNWLGDGPLDARPHSLSVEEMRQT